MKTILPCLFLCSACVPPVSSAPRIIYGNDDRRGVEIPSPEALWGEATALLVKEADVTWGDPVILRHSTLGQKYNLCPGERFASQPSAGFCTAFLVAPDLLATAGHCVDERDAEGNRLARDLVCASLVAVFGYDSVTETARSDVYRCKEIVAAHFHENGGPDFAWVRLDRAVSQRSPLPLRTQGSPRAGTPLAIVGHPAGLPLKVASSETSVVSEPRSGRFRFRALVDNMEGSSGSPVIDPTTGLVEGILVGGWADYVTREGCRQAFVCEGDCTGSDIMRMDLAQSVLAERRPPYDREFAFPAPNMGVIIPPHGKVSMEIEAGTEGTLVDLGVDIALEARFAGDVALSLESPEGRSLVLVEPWQLKGRNIDELLGLTGVPVPGLLEFLPRTGAGLWRVSIANDGETAARLERLSLRLRVADALRR